MIQQNITPGIKLRVLCSNQNLFNIHAVSTVGTAISVSSNGSGGKCSSLLTAGLFAPHPTPCPLAPPLQPPPQMNYSFTDTICLPRMLCVCSSTCAWTRPVQSIRLLRSIFLLLLSCNACRPLMLMRCCCWVDTKPAVIWCVDPCHSTSLIPLWALLCCVTNWTKPLHHHTGPADEHESCVSSD